MVCWLFVGSSIFSASFALLGGQEIVERWVLSLGPDARCSSCCSASSSSSSSAGRWSGPRSSSSSCRSSFRCCRKFGVDPLFFGLLVALNLQTAFLSPPVAMAAFYLKGVSPPHVTLNQIFAGMMPFMGIQVMALALLYIWPQIGLWLPSLLYK